MYFIGIWNNFSFSKNRLVEPQDVIVAIFKAMLIIRILDIPERGLRCNIHVVTIIKPKLVLTKRPGPVQSSGHRYHIQKLSYFLELS